MSYNNINCINESNRLTELFGYIVLLTILFIILGVLLYFSNGNEMINKIFLLISYFIDLLF